MVGWHLLNGGGVGAEREGGIRCYIESLVEFVASLCLLFLLRTLPPSNGANPILADVLASQLSEKA
jgi:hypothetical protein